MEFIVRRQSEHLDNDYNDNNNNVEESYDYRKWEWGYLRTECKNLELEHFYETYVQRLHRSYLSIFFIIHTLIGIIHIITLITTNMYSHQHSHVDGPELYMYIANILLVWITLTATFKEKLVKKFPHFKFIASSVTVLGLVMLDCFVPIYHQLKAEPVVPALRPAYASVILFSIYIFLPIAYNFQCIILGIGTTISYIILTTMITYSDNQHIIRKVITELIYLFCINFFGVYFRLMNEVAIRRAFIDRRECVENNITLKLKRDEEKNLLLSILPQHTAGALEAKFRSMIENMRFNKVKHQLELNSNNLVNDNIPRRQWRGQAINQLYVERHTDVTVLYADVVNYTFMTTQLDVKALVETLHELFVKFDQASEDLKVLRIKFLGDCYYCVSGVPERNPQHAKSCVALGLRMIRDIRDVRISKNNLDIDMRIGIHSGSIMSGVIGACKWQYDIWSNDASIANKLESTGVPGKVHISQRTLDLLDNYYPYESGTEKAKTDALLMSNNIETYLISPSAEINDKQDKQFYQPDDGNYRRYSGAKKKTNNRISKMKASEGKTSVVKRNFMQNSMVQYALISKQTNIEMARELDKMPIGKFHLNEIFRWSSFNRRLTDDSIERKNYRNNVNTIFLFFKDRNWELSFMREPDLMLKYSTLMGYIVFTGILIIQSLNSSHGLIFWIVNGITAFILLSFIPITWFKKLWIIFTPVNEEDASIIIQPKSKFFNYLYTLSRTIITSALSRILIYLVTVILISGGSLIHMIECTESLDEEIFQNVTINDEIVVNAPTYSPCLHPWSITQSLVLALCVNFLFVRINFILKFCIGLIIVSLYTWIIFGTFNFVYETSASISPSIDSNVAHLLTILFTFIIFHLIDRQTEYISRVDYNWKQQLQRKQEELASTKETIKVLVHNILPVHVADIYMAQQMKDELYYEEYENVAIMFATILNYNVDSDAPVDSEKNTLSILNRIICDFDVQLMMHSGPVNIEKIKVAGWTYMVACGLDPGRGDSSASIRNLHGFNAIRTSTTSGGRRHNSSSNTNNRIIPHRESYRIENELTNNRTINNHHRVSTINARMENETKPITSTRQSQNVVYVLTEFALQLMKTLNDFNEENFNPDGKLRIGISHGKIMAGVVGSSKPLYDVWGNDVNMASRMDSTGQPGRIQVTKHTADVLKSFGVECEYRGKTFVKGCGDIPTYFPRVNDHFELVKNNEIDISNEQIINNINNNLSNVIEETITNNISTSL